ncbi:3'-5' exonuclease [Brachybacterium paraconglomeratum]|uniref:3'-5' exonuclease n=1 Tax=Brachybacterium paraconglomeratum TaxID=173362 RepID=UPI00249078A9|nr:3'-5' exonuclease [Brachybacterium paraconglomeratum]
MPNVTFTKTKQKLEPAVGAKLASFLMKLTVDDTTSGLHIEKIHGTADHRVRTGRVDQSYRAVLFLLDGTIGHHYVYAGTWQHDDAIAKAKTMTMRLNQVNGVAEFYDASPVEPTSPVPAVGSAPSGHAPTFQPKYVNPILDLGYTAAYLVEQVGIDLTVAERTLAATDENEFSNAVESAPTWQGVALLDLSAGKSLDEVLKELKLVDEAPEDDEVAPEPSAEEPAAEKPASLPSTGEDDALIKALRHPASQMQFHTLEGVNGVEEVREALERGSFDDWTVFLHPEQRRFATRRNKNSFRVSGGAGTGKTVVAVHRARNLARRDPSSRLILTTFTRTLADSLTEQLLRLDPTVPQAGAVGESGVRVVGIDALAHQVVHSLASAEELATATTQALGYPTSSWIPDPADAKAWRTAITDAGTDLRPGIANPTFLEQEYLMAVLPKRITELAEYARVSRGGRGTPLGRPQRIAVWKTIETYRQGHRLEQKLSFAEIAAVAAQILENRAASGQGRIAEHVIVDEGQDLHPAHWQLLRAAVEPGADDLFIAEDSHQRIYGQKLKLSQYGIDLRGRARRLTLNYRTTAQNLGYALRILDGDAFESLEDLEGLPESHHDYRSVRSGPAPRIIAAKDPAAERAAIAEVVKDWIDGGTPPSAIGVLVRGGQQAAGIVGSLGTVEVKATEIKGNSMGSPKAVQVMTMHRAKGMEFQRVILAGMNATSMPAKYVLASLEDAEREDKLQQERSLLYVAASRARDELVVTYSGEVSGFLP